MTDLSRWPDADALLERALELPPGERDAFLEREVLDPKLRRALEAILKEDVDDTFLNPESARERPLFREMGDSLEVPERVPAQLGSYRVIRELGRGGMARVYLAERTDGGFSQQVALKVIRGGADSGQLHARFEQERQILAGLTHPNIAHLLDGGQSREGWLFFAMELVEGLALEEHCRQQSLPLAERLRLFLEVADAVAYAHRNLVVHRDIKSSNVLVTADGVVKLLDFGIAKVLLPDQRPAEDTAMRPFTPEFASPEQVAGAPVTTASDIYQLGHLLYRLLTARSPYDATSGGDVGEAILTATPTRPSLVVTRSQTPGESPSKEINASWSQSLRGDLDAIVLKALRKEPERRYDSVGDLIEDVRAYLRGRPVKARGDRTSYLIGKFIARHRAATSVAALAAGVMLVMAATFTVRVKTERDRALEQARRAEVVSDYLEGIFEVPSPLRSLGGEVSAVDLIEAAVTRMERELEQSPAVRAALQGVLGTSYRNLNLVEAAEPLLIESLAYFESHGTPGQLREALLRVADLQGFRGAHDECLELVARAEEANRSREQPTEPAAEPLIRARLAIQSARCRVAQMKGLDLAEREATDAVRMLEKATTASAEQRVEALLVLGNTHLARAQYEAADEVHQRALDLASAELGENHWFVLDALEGMAVTRSLTGDAEGALDYRLQLLNRWTERYGPDHPSAAGYYHGVAAASARLGRHQEAEQAYLKALALQPGGDTIVASGFMRYNLATLYVRQQRAEDALREYRHSLRIMESVSGPDSRNVTLPLQLLGDLLSQLERCEEAEPMLERTLDLLESTVGGDHPSTARSMSYLAAHHARCGAEEESLPLLQTSYEIYRSHFGADHDSSRRVAAAMADRLESLGRSSEATSWRSRALVEASASPGSR